MPFVSVVMSSYNREDIIKETIDSILNQSYSDFEFIIINDASADKTEDIIKSCSDSRILYLKNKQNCGCTFNYHVAHNIAKGKYIVHIDDDDISHPDRIKIQTEYMENNPYTALAGAYIETFGENKRPSWVFYTDGKMLELAMNIYNPICHSSVIYRKEYLDRHYINYDISKKCSQDYDLYKQIILSGGKLANIPKILVKYRMHKNRMTDIKETQDIQIKNADNIKNELLSRFFNRDEINDFNSLSAGFPYNKYSIYNVVKALEKIKMTEYYRTNALEAELEQIINDVKNKKFVF